MRVVMLGAVAVMCAPAAAHAYEVPPELIETDLPFVASNGLFFLEADHYGSETLVSRLVYLTDEGAIKIDEQTGTFSIDHSRVKDAVRKLTHDLLTIEAEGSYDKAKAILEKYAVIRSPMKRALDRLKDVPVDIEPIFPAN